mgnify:CR=1 FL=1
MATMRPLYSSVSADIAVVGGGAGTDLHDLSNGSIGYSTAIDNSTALYMDYLIEVYLDGTAAATGWAEVRCLPMIDGTNYALWESGSLLGTIDFSVDLQRAIFSVIGHGGYFQVPQYFKIAVKNSTGAAFTAGTIKWQGVNIQSV